MANKKSKNKGGSLCSGYKVFPDGRKCKGCIDCDFLKSKKSIEQVFKESHTTVTVSRNKPFDLIGMLTGRATTAKNKKKK